MRSLSDWLDEYSKDHQNSVNKKYHMVCVPLIFLSVIGFLDALPLLMIFDTGLKWSWIVAIPVLIFYFTLHILSGFIFVFIIGGTLLLFHNFVSPEMLMKASIGIFIIGWIGQFIGHKYEGKKPSFFKDLLFLLIGPLWVFHKFSPKSGPKSG